MQITDISAEWLSDILGSERGSVTGLEIENIGEGVGFGGAVFRVRLTWDSHGAGPASIIVKLPVQHEITRQAMQRTGTFFREARFYKTFACNLTGLPDIYFVDIGTLDFVIVMEDLGEIVRERPFLSEPQIEASLRAIAAFHAKFWNNPVCRESWLTPIEETTGEAADELQERVQTSLSLLEASGMASSTLLQSVRRLVKLLPKRPGSLPQAAPFTLVHGDFHGDNLTFASDSVTIFDWQLVAMGSPLSDVANMLASSADPATFTGNIDKRLHVYRQALEQAGITFPPNQLKRNFDIALFFVFLKFTVVLGMVDGDNRTRLRQRITELEHVAQISNAASYLRWLPAIFLGLRVLNFFRRL